MKKLLLFAAALFALAALSAPLSAHAEEESPAAYARVEQNGVYLYSAADDAEGLFALPRSYFVRILGETAQYYFVSYQADKADAKAVRGYCKKSEVSPVAYQPETPYLDYKITVTYSVDGNFVPGDPLSTFQVQAQFYGTYLIGTGIHYYVYRDGNFGYVPAKSCSPLDYPINTEHTEPDAPPANEDDGKTSSPKNNAIRIVLVCTLSVFAIGAVYFLFRPQKGSKRPRDPFYDENENY